MTPFGLAQLRKDEGFEPRAYRDGNEIWTVGFGEAHVSPDATRTLAQANANLIANVARFEHELDEQAPWWKSLDPVRADALSNICYNRGIGGLLAFTHFVAAMRDRNYDLAARDLRLTQPWYGELKGRAVRLANEIETGVRG